MFLNQDNDTSEEDTTPRNIPLGNIKKDLELEKILFNKNSKRKSKTIKKMNQKFLKNKSEEDEEDSDSELEFIKITKKKRKSLRNINSFINSLNNMDDEDLLKNNNGFNFLGTNSLSKEDMNQLIMYSTKLRKLAELDESQKTEELIRMEKEIKEKI